MWVLQPSMGRVLAAVNGGIATINGGIATIKRGIAVI
jgi:hypothetical protein